MSTKNLRYLSMDQVLADLAYFVQHIKNTKPELAKSKVVVVGGSYAGTMATWLRLKYPHVVDAALASSAPLTAVADFYKYYEVVSESIISKGGQKCYDILEKGSEQLIQEMKKPGGPEAIAELFHLCSPVDPNSPLDYGWFMSDLSGVFGAMVQFSVYDEIEYNCNDLIKKTGNNSELYGLGTFVAWKSQTCHDVSFNNSVNSLKDISWENPLRNVRNWVYIACTMLGLAHTDSSKNQPFGNGINNLDLYVSYCRDLFGEEFEQNSYQIFEAGVERTNLLYGALTHEITKVIFTHGSIDPWKSLGHSEDANELAPIIIIPDASHCEDLQSKGPTDSEEMKAARQRTLDIMKEWLK